MDLNAALQVIVTAAGITVSGLWFMWQRYQSLEKRFSRIESELTMAKHRQETIQLVAESNEMNIRQLVTANKELIEHRTRRFSEQLEASEGRLTTAVKEIQRWLDEHTEFKIRDR